MLSLLLKLVLPTEPGERTRFLDSAEEELSALARQVVSLSTDPSITSLGQHLRNESPEVGPVYFTTGDEATATNELIYLVWTRQAAQVLETGPDLSFFEQWVAEQHRYIAQLRSEAPEEVAA